MVDAIDKKSINPARAWFHIDLSVIISLRSVVLYVEGVRSNLGMDWINGNSPLFPYFIRTKWNPYHD